MELTITGYVEFKTGTELASEQSLSGFRGGVAGLLAQSALCVFHNIGRK